MIELKIDETSNDNRLLRLGDVADMISEYFKAKIDENKQEVDCVDGAVELMRKLLELDYK